MRWGLGEASREGLTCQDAGHPERQSGSPPVHGTSQPTLGSCKAISSQTRKASQLETLLAGAGRPRLDWVWVCRGGNSDLHGAAGSDLAGLLGTPSVKGNAFIPEASKARLQLPPAGRHKRQIPSLGSHHTPSFSRLWCVRNMPASKAAFSPFPPSGMPLPLLVSMLSFLPA